MRIAILAILVWLPAELACATPLQQFRSSLVRAENAMLQGAEGAARERSMLLARAPSSLPVDFTQSRERQTAAILVLSGFSPLLLSPCLQDPDCGGQDRPVLQAARLHGEGKTAEAAAAIAALGSPAGMPDALTALLMMAEAQGLAATQRARALERLALARLAAPGTLVEEAALRASLTLVDVREEPARAALLTRQLVTRFSRSHYMPAFMPRVIAAAAQLPDGPAAGLLDAVPAPLAQSISLERAREAALALDADRLRAEADRLRLQGLSDAAAARLTLYEAAVQSVGPQQEAGRRAASALDNRLLDPRDQDLMRAVVGRKGMVHGGVSAMRAAPAVKPSREQDTMLRERIAEAERLLRSTDRLMEAAP